MKDPYLTNHFFQELNISYPYLSIEELKELYHDGKEMIDNGTLEKDEMHKYLQWYNDQNIPMTFNQWYATQPI